MNIEVCWRLFIYNVSTVEGFLDILWVPLHYSGQRRWRIKSNIISRKWHHTVYKKTVCSPSFYTNWIYEILLQIIADLILSRAVFLDLVSLRCAREVVGQWLLLHCGARGGWYIMTKAPHITWSLSQLVDSIKCILLRAARSKNTDCTHL
jgi:hypothetical protein